MQDTLNNTQTIDNTAKTVSSEETGGASDKGKEIVPDFVDENNTEKPKPDKGKGKEIVPDSVDEGNTGGEIDIYEWEGTGFIWGDAWKDSALSDDDSYDSDETIKPTRIKGKPVPPEDKQAHLTSWLLDPDEDSDDENYTEKPKSGKGSGSGSGSGSSVNNGYDINGYNTPSLSSTSPSPVPAPAPTRSGGENLEGNDRFDANNFKMSVSEFKYLDMDMQDYILEIIKALLKYIG